MFTDMDYLVKFAKIPIGIVVHAGANTCQEAAFYQSCGFSQVIWIESLSHLVRESREKLKIYPKQHIIEATLWEFDDLELEFKVASNDGESSSLLDMNMHRAIHPSIIETEKIKKITKSLDTIINNKTQILKDGDSISLLVLDLQGVELQVLKGALKTLAVTQAIQVEVSKVKIYSDQNLFFEIHEFLKKVGFDLVSHDLLDGGLMGNALYIREEIISRRNLAILPAQDLKKRVYISYRYRIKLLLIRLGFPQTTLTKSGIRSFWKNK